MTPSLLQRSIEIILANQHPSGAYLASPNFPTYHYSWFRDGTYIAYAMDLAGETESARQFHQWVAQTILRHEDTARRAAEKARANQPLSPEDVLHTRYTVTGEAAAEDWPNFQSDGFGAWLWGLSQHLDISSAPLSGECERAARLIADYLAALWQHPCYDCWEEFGDHVHAYTLAAIYGGLEACTRMGLADYRSVTAAIREKINTQLFNGAYFSKFIGTPLVDSSLLGLAVPYGVVDPRDARMRATVAKIEQDLLHAGGIQRYAEDTYYGGGEWVLLTAWWGWYWSLAGDQEKARQAKAWIEAQANPLGWLPEQVPLHVNAPEHYQPWVQRWGTIANPLLWSQAMYIILDHHLRAGSRQPAS